MCSLAVFLPALVQGLNYSGWNIKTGPGLGLIFLAAAVWMTWAGGVALGLALAALCGILVSVAAYATSELIGARSNFSPLRVSIFTFAFAVAVGVVGAIPTWLWKRASTAS